MQPTHRLRWITWIGVSLFFLVTASALLFTFWHPFDAWLHLQAPKTLLIALIAFLSLGIGSALGIFIGLSYRNQPAVMLRTPWLFRLLLGLGIVELFLACTNIFFAWQSMAIRSDDSPTKALSQLFFSALLSGYCFWIGFIGVRHLRKAKSTTQPG